MSDPYLSPRLRDADLADRFAVNGFCTLPLLDAEAVRSLAGLFDAMFDRPRQGFLSTVLQPPAIRRAAHEAILPHIARALATHAGAFRIALCSFVARYPGSNQGDLPLHQDWSFVDERAARSISVWIPLQAVEAGNGCMTVVPGSHRHEQPPRGIGSGFRYRTIEPELRAHHLIDLPLGAGEAILFDHRLIHGSHSNESERKRLAVGAVLIPESVPLRMGIPRERQYRFRCVPDAFLLDVDFDALVARRPMSSSRDRSVGSSAARSADVAPRNPGRPH